MWRSTQRFSDNTKVEYLGYRFLPTVYEDSTYLLDGMQVDANAIGSIAPCDVDNIDVLKGADAGIF
jgi:hypothetical protein